MQNFDFYSNNKNPYLDYNAQDFGDYTLPQNYTAHTRSFSQKKAHRMLTIIIALIIMSFTAGLVVGIKFAGGQSKAIIDPHTKVALHNAAQKAKTLVQPQQKPQFSKSEYPYAIKIGNYFTKDEATALAEKLSKTGQRIIVSKNKDQYTVYAGPYTSLQDAKKSLKLITAQFKNGNFSNVIILKR
ncbi:MAG: SPOR domain-containing protein [Spirochaetes bacterium]|nr:SPOR domain-containing protein [Spirochaetota bacterium]